MKFSIVITALNRPDVLQKTLDCYTRLKYNPKQFEIIVVDDGSVPSSEKLVNAFKKRSKLNVKYVWQGNKGLASARNTGVRVSKGEYVLISTDDIMPLDADFLSQHEKVHNSQKDVVCLGPVPWHPELELTEVMSFLAPNGPAFNYGAIKNNNDAGYRFFTANVSLRRSWFDKEMFDEGFTGASFDDVEFGYRISKRGVRIVFNPEARLYHYHPYDSFEKFYSAMQKRKSGYDYLISRHPGMKKSAPRILAMGLLAMLGWASFKLTRSRACKHMYWRYVLGYQLFRRW
jgi:GT2 family glycosyltransferase